MDKEPIAELHKFREARDKKDPKAGQWLLRGAERMQTEGKTHDAAFYMDMLAKWKLANEGPQAANQVVLDAYQRGLGVPSLELWHSKLLFEDLNKPNESKEILERLLRSTSFRGYSRHCAYLLLGRVFLFEGQASSALACLKKSLRIKLNSEMVLLPPQMTLVQEFQQKGLYLKECDAYIRKVKSFNKQMRYAADA